MTRHHRDLHSQALFFLIGINFCERCNYYAIKGIFSIYLTERLMFSEHVTTLIYHTFVMTLYTAPLFGAILSEAYLGKYQTILCSAFVYALGNIVLALSAIRALGLPERLLAVVSLTLIAIGTGGLNPIALDFGGDQFDLPKQHKEMDAYYHFFHFVINVGSFLALLIAPLMRRHVHCFGEESCYPLAFFTPAALTVLALAVFRAGKPLYKMAPPEGSMEGRIASCICTAVRNKLKMKEIKKDHWLDYAIEEYGEETVNDTKEVLSIFLVFLPLPIFWSLYEQQATSWTFQARHLTGECGDHLTILADQMQVANPALVLLLFPLFEYVIYPCFARVKLLKTPLQRMAVGCGFAALSFVFAASLQFAIEHQDVRSLAPDKSVIRLFVVFDCNLTLQTGYIGDQNNTITLPPMGFFSHECSELTLQKINLEGTCHKNNDDTNGSLPEIGKYLTCYSFRKDQRAWCELDDVMRLWGTCRVRIIANYQQVHKKSFIIRVSDSEGNVYREIDSDDQSFRYMAPGTYGIEFVCSLRYYVTFKTGAVYAVGVVAQPKGVWLVKAQELFPPTAAIHMMALLPQYAAMAAAEIMFTISGLDFAYDEAPDHMKTVVELLWLLGIAAGQVVVLVFEILKFFDQQYMYLIYAMMMAGATGAFIFITFFCFGYHHHFWGQQEEEEDDEN